MTTDTIERTDIMLSVQRALLGNVTSNLRGVAVDWDDRLIHLVCYYNGVISDDDRETMSCAHTEVVADFIDHKPVQMTLERLDTPNKMNGFRAWAFLRKE